MVCVSLEAGGYNSPGARDRSCGSGRSVPRLRDFSARLLPPGWRHARGALRGGRPELDELDGRRAPGGRDAAGRPWPPLLARATWWPFLDRFLPSCQETPRVGEPPGRPRQGSWRPEAPAGSSGSRRAVGVSVFAGMVGSDRVRTGGAAPAGAPPPVGADQGRMSLVPTPPSSGGGDRPRPCGEPRLRATSILSSRDSSPRRVPTCPGPPSSRPLCPRGPEGDPMALGAPGRRQRGAAGSRSSGRGSRIPP